MTLDALVALGEDVRSRTRTLGAAIAGGVSPLTGQPMFKLPEDEIFIGMGVHGEPGVARRKLGPVRDLVAFMVEQILEDRETPATILRVPMVLGPGELAAHGLRARATKR